MNDPKDKALQLLGMAAAVSPPAPQREPKDETAPTTRGRVDEKEQAAAEMDAFQILRRRNGELAGDRDQWRARAEMAERRADPARVKQLEDLADVQAKEVAGLQRKLAAEKIESAKFAGEVEGHRRIAARLEHELQQLRVTAEDAFKARDRAWQDKSDAEGTLEAVRDQLEGAEHAAALARQDKERLEEEAKRYGPLVMAAVSWYLDPRKDGAAAALRKAAQPFVGTGNPQSSATPGTR